MSISKVLSMDVLKWSAGLLVSLLAVTLNFLYFDQVGLLYRVLLLILLFALSAWVISSTHQGQWMLEALKNANFERRKIIWPNRHETWQATLLVMVLVFVSSLFLWGVDSLLAWALSAVIH